ncbi:MAG: CcoQ/FixQ family Cbb3-type cytochrome c oxidase assembly chaperone [Bacteroidia bacterium]|jgi:cbb3-type cytochrome oxidase subunit 3|nr:CcoQ/FixQ family Cbb3-type cytochrome c oxidase assembly chaperone [Bacteroidia bacterium]
MKFSSYLESITGVGIFPLLSLLMFVLFFTVVALWAFKAEKKMIDTMKQLPLDSAETNSADNNQSDRV